MEISSFEADLLEMQAKRRKMIMIFITTVTKLIEMAGSGFEVWGAYSSCSLFVRQFTVLVSIRYLPCGGIYFEIFKPSLIHTETSQNFKMRIEKLYTKGLQE